MNFEETFLKGCFVITPAVFSDPRGYFFESFHSDRFKEQTGQNINFVQDNESRSGFGVVRGLHMQRAEWAQAKLVRVFSGQILDVAVDVRKDSPTFGQSFSIELSGENKKQLFIPEGFLHGFSVLSPEAVVCYKCNRFYNKESEDGINPLDSKLNIDWKIPIDKIILSDKDKSAKSFDQLIPF